MRYAIAKDITAGSLQVQNYDYHSADPSSPADLVQAALRLPVPLDMHGRPTI